MTTEPRKRQNQTRPTEMVRRKRGIATQRKMLDALQDQLQTRPYRDLRVVDIAEAVGVTPAAFYQYFTDLKGAILVLAEEMAADAQALPQLVLGDWETEGFTIAQRVVDGFMDFWTKHDAVLRVVELALDERDSDFNRVRSAMLSESHLALSFVIGNLQAKGLQPASVNPRALAAAVLASVLHVNSRLALYNRWGAISTDDIRNSLVDVIYTMVVRPEGGVRTAEQ